MMVGMALIICFSGVMHVYLVRKKAIRTHRYQPQYGKTPGSPEQKLLENGGTLQGEVVAVSFDKFFLRSGNNKVQPVAIGTLPMPEVGKRVTVTVTGGKLLTAVALVLGDQPAATSTPP